MSFQKIILAVLIILVCAGAYLYGHLVVYGFEQAKGQISIITGARDFSSVMADAHTPNSVKTKLAFITEVKQFAEDSLGINSSKNYTTYYQQHIEPLMLVLTACAPLSFTEYEWSFPVIGNFSYKGFFNHTRAKSERDKLKTQGYDTGLGTVSGWSTLGWLRDPVLSGMLNQSEGELAELIIHELTHGTLYVKNDVAFNENLASFVGEKGAIRFLQARYGHAAPRLRAYTNELEDQKNIRHHMLRGYQQLDSLYKTFTTNTDTAAALVLKQNMIAFIFLSTDTLTLHHSDRKQKIIKRMSTANNTYFMSYKRYHGSEHNLNSTLQARYAGDINKMLDDLKIQYPSL